MQRRPSVAARERAGRQISAFARSSGRNTIHPYLNMEKEIEELKKLHQFYLYHDYKTGEIAKKLNVSPRTVRRWLSGKTKPSDEKLKQIRKFLDEKRQK